MDFVRDRSWPMFEHEVHRAALCVLPMHFIVHNPRCRDYISCDSDTRVQEIELSIGTPSFKDLCGIIRTFYHKHAHIPHYPILYVFKAFEDKDDDEDGRDVCHIALQVQYERLPVLVDEEHDRQRDEFNKYIDRLLIDDTRPLPDDRDGSTSNRKHGDGHDKR
jgi:hypothetical protein